MRVIWLVHVKCKNLKTRFLLINEACLGAKCCNMSSMDDSGVTINMEQATNSLSLFDSIDERPKNDGIDDEDEEMTPAEVILLYFHAHYPSKINMPA